MCSDRTEILNGGKFIFGALDIQNRQEWQVQTKSGNVAWT